MQFLQHIHNLKLSACFRDEETKFQNVLSNFLKAIKPVSEWARVWTQFSYKLRSFQNTMFHYSLQPQSPNLFNMEVHTLQNQSSSVTWWNDGHLHHCVGNIVCKVWLFQLLTSYFGWGNRGRLPEGVTLELRPKERTRANQAGILEKRQKEQVQSPWEKNKLLVWKFDGGPQYLEWSGRETTDVEDDVTGREEAFSSYRIL